MLIEPAEAGQHPHLFTSFQLFQCLFSNTLQFIHLLSVLPTLSAQSRNIISRRVVRCLTTPTKLHNAIIYVQARAALRATHH
jgi:hypothetical protein